MVKRQGGGNAAVAVRVNNPANVTEPGIHPHKTPRRKIHRQYIANTPPQNASPGCAPPPSYIKLSPSGD